MISRRDVLFFSVLIAVAAIFGAGVAFDIGKIGVMWSFIATTTLSLVMAMIAFLSTNRSCP